MPTPSFHYRPMNQQPVDSHQVWLEDVEYRGEYGSESAKLEIAAALADARALAGVTQRDLAERAGVSQAYVAKLEQGGANPTIGNVGRLFACIWMKPAIQPVPLEPSRAVGLNFYELAPPVEPVGEVEMKIEAWQGEMFPETPAINLTSVLQEPIVAAGGH